MVRGISKLDEVFCINCCYRAVQVNAPVLFRALTSMLLQVVHPETRAKLKVFGNGPNDKCVSSEAAVHLVHLCGAEVLPSELGGDLPPGSPPYGFS